MKTIYTIIVLLFCSWGAYADGKTDANVFGHIVDSKTGEHLPFVPIQVKGTNIGANTDQSGHYFIKNLPLGEQTIIVSALGYAQSEYKIQVRKNTSLEVNISLSPAALSLAEVVVSSSRLESAQRKSPVAINSISPKAISSTSSSRLSECIAFTPGLRIETDCQNCGFTQLRMNGLKGEYTQILIDGKPIFSGTASVYGLEQIPTTMIDRIEIVKGGGSALFGSSAIAGSVNILTKEPLKNTWEISTTLGAFSKETVDKGASFNTSVVNDDLTNGLFIFGMVKERDSFDKDGDSFSELPTLKNTGLGIRAFQKLPHRVKVGIEYHHLKEFRRGGNLLEATPHLADIAEMLTHNINGGMLSAEYLSDNKRHKLAVFTSMQHLYRDSYYGGGGDMSGYGLTKDVASSLGVHYTGSFNHWKHLPSTFTVGTERNLAKVNDSKNGYINSLGENIPKTTIANQQNTTYAAFVQANTELFERAKLQVGLRADSYSIKDKEGGAANFSGTEFTPSASLLISWDEHEHLQTRISYANGFRAPQLFSEDLHVNLQGAQRVERRLSPNLKVEKSHSITGSITYTFEHLAFPMQVSVDGFYTSIENPFHDVFKETNADGVKIVEKGNAAGAKVYGSNIEAKLMLSNRSSVEGGVTLQSSKYNQQTQWGEQNENKSFHMLKSPNTYGYLLGTIGISQRLTFSANATITGPMQVAHIGVSPSTTNPEELEALQKGWVIAGEQLKTSPTFFDLGAKLSYEFNLSGSSIVTLDAGLKNVLNSYQNDFDRGKFRDSNYIYGPGTPRLYYVSIKFGNIN